MIKIVGERSIKTGLPPGSLVHVGKKKRETVAIHLIEYNEHEYKESFLDRIEGIVNRNKEVISWINISGIHDVDLLKQLGNVYGIHDLVLEDILNTEQRPKIEDYGNYLYIVAKMVYYQKHHTETVIEQVSIIVGENYIITFQENGNDVFAHLSDRLKHQAFYPVPVQGF